MKLNSAPDSEYYFERLVSEDGKIEIGIYPVMFGYRVRAGFIDAFCSEIDWCGGADQTQVELLYSIAKNIIEHQGDFTNMLMSSEIKPFYNDTEFTSHITSLTKAPLEIIKLQPLSVYKKKLMNNLLGPESKL